MSGRNYTPMSQNPSHGNASLTQAGSGRENFSMGKMGGEYDYGNKYPSGGGDMGGCGCSGGSYAPGLAGGCYDNNMCHFPQPPPRRVYCQPAPFSGCGCGSGGSYGNSGAGYFNLISAYGMSRPAYNNY